MGNLKKSSATHQTTSPRPMEADEIRTSPSPISTAVTITSPSPMVRTSPTPTSTDKVRTDSARTSPSPTPADVSRTCPSPMSTAVTRTSTSPMVRTSPTPTSVDMERRSVSPTSANVRTTSTTDVLPKTDNRCEHAAKQRTLINSLLQRFSRPAPISPDPVSEEIEQTINLETIETIPLPKKQGHKTPLWDAAADPSTRSLEAVGLIPVETCSRLLDKQQKKKGRKRRLRATQTSTKTTAKKPRGKQIEHSGQN